MLKVMLLGDFVPWPPTKSFLLDPMGDFRSTDLLPLTQQKFVKSSTVLAYTER